MLTASRVVLLTRAGCHLCEDAEAVVSAVCEGAGIGWHAVDVDSDERLRADWSDHVPVTFVDGELHARWFLDAGGLRNALRDHAAHLVPADWRPDASAVI